MGELVYSYPNILTNSNFGLELNLAILTITEKIKLFEFQLQTINRKVLKNKDKLLYSVDKNNLYQPIYLLAGVEN